jgi:hypothetical protein
VTDVEAARKAWVAEKPQFERFGNLLADSLRNGIRKLGIPGNVSVRAKELDSLVKKLLLKRGHTYDSMPDKIRNSYLPGRATSPLATK